MEIYNFQNASYGRVAHCGAWKPRAIFVSAYLGFLDEGSGVINKSSCPEFLTLEPFSINDRASVCLYYSNGTGEMYRFHNYFNNDIISTVLLLLTPTWGISLPLWHLCLVYNGKSGGGHETRFLISNTDRHSSIHTSENAIEAIRGQSLWFTMVASAVCNLTGASLCQE